MLGLKEKASYGLGAVGKDMVYMLSASYILYYFQDILGVSAAAMGVILLVARVFDAFNDPIMGVVDEDPLGQIPTVAFNRHSHQRGGSLFDVRRSSKPFCGRSCRLRGGHLYRLGCDLHDDGHSLLVDDSRFHERRKGARGTYDFGAKLRGCRLGSHLDSHDDYRSGFGKNVRRLCSFRTRKSLSRKSVD